MDKKLIAIAEKLVPARKAKSYTQGDIAVLLQMKQSAVSRLEKGAYRLDLEKAVKLAQHLDVKPEEIFYDYDAACRIGGLNHIEFTTMEIDIFQEVKEMIEGTYTLSFKSATDRQWANENLYKLLRLQPMLLERIERIKRELIGYEKEVYHSGQVRISDFQSCPGKGYHRDFEYQKELETKYHQMVVGYLYASMLFNRICLHANKDELYMLYHLLHCSSFEQNKMKEKMFALMDRSITYVNPIRLERLVSSLQDYLA